MRPSPTPPWQVPPVYQSPPAQQVPPFSAPPPPRPQPSFPPPAPHAPAQVPPSHIPRQAPPPWTGRSPAVDNRVMWFGSDGTVHYVPAYPAQAPPPPPRRRRRWAGWVALGVVGVLLLCVAPATFVVSQLPGLSLGSADAADPARSKAPSPGPNSPPRVRLAWVTQQIAAALDRQTEALLRGDQKEFLATVDPKATKLAVALKRRFGSLRELQVTRYTQRIASMPAEEEGIAGQPGWEVRVDIAYCFVVRECDTDEISVDTAWAETSAGVRMTSLEQTIPEHNGPRPWETSVLKASVGERTVVAVTNRYAARLPALLREAEKAAAVADRFVIGGERPDRYRVFIAGPSEWRRWYGGELPDWSVGFATAISRDRMEVVLNINQIEGDYLDEVMRHELGHVATLSTDERAGDDNFWLVEGMAEYIQETGRSVAGYDGREAVRKYLDEKKWDGDVAVPQPDEDSADWEVAAAYGIGYYAVRRMAERFGRAKMVSFFSEVVLERGRTLDTAAREAFGVSWSNVNADCAKYIRRNT